MKPLNVVIGIVALIWTAVIIYTWTAPVVPLGGDSVYPTAVVPGQDVIIKRSFKVTRDTHVVVTRQMSKGNCAESCDVIGMTSTTMFLTKGTYPDRERKHTIPLDAAPGIWRMEFAFNYENILGKTLTVPLPVVLLEVTK